MALSPYRRFRLNRSFRKIKRSLQDFLSNVAQYLKTHVIDRYLALKDARRFVMGWAALFVLVLLGVYLQLQHANSGYIIDGPVEGGNYTEGVVGKVTNLNPIFATGRANSSASKLIFSGLFSYDQNGSLEPSLAESYEVNEDGTEYTVTLKEEIYFHDGEPITSRDVLFTIRAIQRPDTRSPFQSSWRDIKVSIKGDRQVVFTLPNAYSPFPHSLTMGIIPEHLLEEIQPGDLRAEGFNTQPVGSGPFKFKSLNNRTNYQDLELVPYENYHKGKPLLDSLTLRSFDDHDSMIDAYKKTELSGVSGLRTFDIPQLSDSSIDIKETPMTSQVYAFFNNSKPKFKDVKIRKALTLLINKKDLIRNTDFTFSPSQSPLLKNHLGFNSNIRQEYNDPKKAEKLLKEAGYKKEDGVYAKNGKKLSFEIITQNTDEYPEVAEELQKQWVNSGIEASIKLVEPNDLQQGFIQPHAYEVLLFGITLGADPDVFAYWHSTQSSQGGFNLAEYKSEIADEALEAGRTRLDRQIRAAKYKTFLRQWVKDNPSAVLYSPQFIYGHHPKFAGALPEVIVEPADRFNMVETWTIRKAPIKRSF